jgi:hypothetical protein
VEFIWQPNKFNLLTCATNEKDGASTSLFAVYPDYRKLSLQRVRPHHPVQVAVLDFLTFFYSTIKIVTHHLKSCLFARASAGAAYVALPNRPATTLPLAAVSR